MAFVTKYLYMKIIEWWNHTWIRSEDLDRIMIEYQAPKIDFSNISRNGYYDIREQKWRWDDFSDLILRDNYDNFYQFMYNELHRVKDDLQRIFIPDISPKSQSEIEKVFFELETQLDTVCMHIRYQLHPHQFFYLKQMLSTFFSDLREHIETISINTKEWQVITDSTVAIALLYWIDLTGKSWTIVIWLQELRRNKLSIRKIDVKTLMQRIWEWFREII